MRHAVDKDRDFGDRDSKARVAKWTASQLIRSEGGKKLIAEENKVQGERPYML